MHIYNRKVTLCRTVQTLSKLATRNQHNQQCITRFAGGCLLSTDCLSAHSYLQASLAPFLENRTSGGVALYDVALHKNLGDAVLWAAAARLVPSFHESVKYVCAQSQFPGKAAAAASARKHFPKCNVQAMLKAIGANGVVLLAPGGNWGDLWWFVHSQRLGYLQEMTQAAMDGTPFKVSQVEVIVSEKRCADSQTQVYVCS